MFCCCVVAIFIVALGFTTAHISDAELSCVTSDGQNCTYLLESSYATRGCKFSYSSANLTGYSLSISLKERARPIYAIAIVQCHNADTINKISLTLDDGSTQQLFLSTSSSLVGPWADIFYIPPVLSQNLTLEIVEMSQQNQTFLGLNQILIYDTAITFSLSNSYGSSCTGTYPGCSGALETTIAGIFIGIDITEEHRWQFTGPAVGAQINITFLKPYLIDSVNFYQLYDIEHDNGSFCKIDAVRLEFSDGTMQEVNLPQECYKYGAQKHLQPVTTHYVHMTVLSTHNEDNNIPAGFEEIQFRTLDPYKDTEVIYPTTPTQQTSSSTKVASKFFVMLLLTVVHFDSVVKAFL